MSPIRIALVLLLLHSVQAKQAPVAGASIEGVVVDRVTGAALSGISVEVTGIVGTKVETFAAKTDKAGKFVLKNVPPSIPYWLIATPPTQERRYILAVYGQRGLTGPGTPITLQANQQMKDVRLALIPTGTISGRILNEKGKPVVGFVQATSPAYEGGPRARDYNEIRNGAFWNGFMNPFGSAQLNNRGEYRITALPPGQYYLSIVGKGSIRISRTIVRVGPGSPQTDYDSEDYSLSTFFPGTTDANAASLVDLRAGASVNNLDFRIAPVRPRRIRGVVIDDTSGARAASAELLIVPRNAPPDSDYTRSVRANKGTFEIGNVFPGSYFIVAFIDDQNRTQTGRTSIEVGKDHLENVTLRVGPGFDVTGRVVFESGERAGDSAMMRTRVTLRPRAPSEPGILPEPTGKSVTLDIRNQNVMENAPSRSALALQAVTSTIGSDGRLSLRGVAPWDYTVEVSSPFEDSYVKSIRMGNLDVLNEGISVDGPSSGVLEIVISSDAGSVDGRVLDEKSKPVENIKVVIVPAGVPQNRIDLFKTAWSSRTGDFRITQVPPGEYTLYAWEYAEEGAWRDPEFLRLYEGRGTLVHVRGRSNESVEARVIPPWF